MFGSHLSVAGGMEKAIAKAVGYGMETVQVFTKSPQLWAAKPLDPGEVRKFREAGEKAGFREIVAHDSYLINMAAKEDALWEKSIAGFGNEMRRCDELGISYLVTHPGAHCGTGEECGIDRVIAGIIRLLKEQVGGKVTVCLETTAGQGTCLGCKFEQIAAMLAGIDKAGLGERVGVCVDTCHILAAGYDLTTAEKARGVVAELDRVIGLKRVKVWHLNDSKKGVGSRVDRHEHIGRGCVGVEAFGVICSDPRMAGVPKIMETPKEAAPDGREWDVVNLELLRGLAAGQKVVPVVFEEKAVKKEKKVKRVAKVKKG